MNDDLATSIDNEMGGLIDDGSTGNPGSSQDPNAGQTAPQTSVPQTLKAGGREFKTAEELAKSYDNLWRMHGKLANEAKPWLGFRDQLKQHPELRQKYLDATKQYHDARQAGLTPKGAEQAAGIPPEVAQRLERMEAAYEDGQVEKEMNSLRDKYKLDNAALREVLKIAEANDGIPLELAYKAYAHDSGHSAARVQAAKEAKNAADSTKAGGLAPGVQAAQKGMNLASDRSWRENAGAALGKFGLE